MPQAPSFECLGRFLRRLGVDCADLWQLHAWDPWTPIDETLAAVDAAIAAGKVRYAGVSNYLRLASGTGSNGAGTPGSSSARWCRCRSSTHLFSVVSNAKSSPRPKHWDSDYSPGRHWEEAR